MGKRHWSFYRSELLTNQGLIKNFDKFANRKNKIKLLNKTEYIIETIKKEESYLRRRYFIKHMDLYGSYAKKMQRPESDIDLVYNSKW